MKLRRRSMITREGWYYLFILAFVIVGSLLRHINLLVGLSAILSTAMLFNWRTTRAGLRQLQFGRKSLPPVWCHRPTTFEVEVYNPRKYLSSFSIMVSQRFRPKRILNSTDSTKNWLQRAVQFLRGNTVSNYVLLDTVHVGQTRIAQQILEFRDRGEYEMGPLTISTHFPLGLTRREIRDETRLPLLVGPALGALTYGWVDRMLGLGWQDATGGSTSRSGEEFFSLRPWMNGDSRRWVHWRATARHGTVLVRQFQRSQSKAFSLVVDFTSFDDETKTADDLEKILRIVATISNSVREGHADTARITLICDDVYKLNFPCTEVEWTNWHRILSTIVPTSDGSKFLRQLIDEPIILGLGLSDTAPAVILSPRTLDEFTREIRSLASDAEIVSQSGVTNSTTNEGTNSTTEQDAAVAVARQVEEPKTKPTGHIWSIQRQIRTWLTPGDSRLVSWYIDAPAWKEDPMDLTAEENAE